jgi:hypothetical protein
MGIYLNNNRNRSKTKTHHTYTSLPQRLNILAIKFKIMDLRSLCSNTANPIICLVWHFTHYTHMWKTLVWPHQWLRKLVECNRQMPRRVNSSYSTWVSTWTIIETEAKRRLITHIHDLSISWLGPGIWRLHSTSFRSHWCGHTSVFHM